jgi:hypothetical protein
MVVQEAGELGVNGVTVLLKNAAGTTLQSTTTTNNQQLEQQVTTNSANLAPGRLYRDVHDTSRIQ